MPITDTDALTSYTALLVGGLIAFSLTGTVSVQCLVYYRLFPKESGVFKGLVAGVWFLDLLHTAFIGASLYQYLVAWFGEESQINVIPSSVALTIVVTAVQTLIAHCFFANKIYRSSRKNWYFTGPVLLLALLRLIAAGISTGEMIADKRYSVFENPYPGWIFTLGLTLSSMVDVLIAACLCYLLRKLKLQMGSTSTMIKVVDTLTLYTLENGFLTGVATTASLICWLSMPRNLSFLGLHFVIAKLYANSVLASLNTRKELRDMRPQISPWADPSLPVLSADDFGLHHPRDPLNLLNPLDRYISRPPTPMKSHNPLEVTVERVVEQESESLRALTMMTRFNSDSSKRVGSPYRFDQSRRVSRTPTVLSWKQHTHAEYPDFDIPPRYP
jgi:hypothetical protein